MSGRSIQIFTDIEQNSEAWYEARRGKATASRMSDIMAAQRDPAKDGVRTKYMRQLAGEIIAGSVDPNRYKNADMERGHEQEPDALDRYKFATDHEVELVGFVYDEDLRFGYSPDGLIVGKRGAVEIKTKQRDLLIECIQKYRDRCPPSHLKQLQAGMLVAQLDFVDLVIYCPGLPLYRVVVERDDHFLVKLKEEIAQFNFELDALVAMLRRYESGG